MVENSSVIPQPTLIIAGIIVHEAVISASTQL